MKINKPVIVCEAIPFGFGPAAILKSIISKMEDDFEIIIVTSGSTYLYFENLHFKLIRCSSYDKNEIKATLINIGKIDFILSVENERVIEVAQFLNIKTAYLNVFEYIWSLNETYLLNSDIYIVYNLFETPEQIENAKKKSDSIFFLKPEITEKEYFGEKEGILIHLGGLNSHCIKNEHQFYYSDIILSVLRDFYESYDVKVITNKALNIYLSAQNRYNNIEFLTVSPDEFSSILYSSKYYFTTPGIYSTLQGFQTKTITNLLLPANYTQVFQLEAFNRLSNFKFPSFSYLFDSECLVSPTGEREGLSVMFKALERMRTDVVFRDKYKQLLFQLIDIQREQERLNDQNNLIKSVNSNTLQLIDLIKEKCK